MHFKKTNIDSVIDYPKTHVHVLPTTCECSLTALEPDENCPVHGLGEYPPRCGVCGRFMSLKSRRQ